MKADGYFAFTRGIYEQVWLDDEHTTCTHKHIGDHFYEVELVNHELLKVTRDGVSKTILVRDDHNDFVYSCKKTYITARDRATGLFDTLARCIHDDGTVWNSATLYTVCDHVIDSMKPAPKRPPMTLCHDRILDALKWSAQNKGCGVDVIDSKVGWLAFLTYRYGGGCAELYLPTARVRLTFELDGVSKADFIKAAATDLTKQLKAFVSEYAA